VSWEKQAYKRQKPIQVGKFLDPLPKQAPQTIYVEEDILEDHFFKKRYFRGSKCVIFFGMKKKIRKFHRNKNT